MVIQPVPLFRGRYSMYGKRLVKMKRLVLIDGNSLLFRAYFAMRPMVTSTGLHTQGIFAFINMLNKIIKDYEPDYMAVAFDMKEKTFRHEQYDGYKAGRQQAPCIYDELSPVLDNGLLQGFAFRRGDIRGIIDGKGQETIQLEDNVWHTTTSNDISGS